MSADAFEIAQSDNPERVRAMRAPLPRKPLYVEGDSYGVTLPEPPDLTPAQIAAECGRLGHKYGAHVSFAIAARPHIDPKPDMSLNVWRSGARDLWFDVPSTVRAAFAEVEARLEFERLGIMEVV